MNINNLQIILQEAIDNSTKTVDYLLLSKAIQALNMGQIRSVATFANLPAAASNEGLLVFVEADERLYWSTGTDWYSIVTDNKAAAWSWGNNDTGLLGNNTLTCSSSPVSVVGGFTDWCRVSAGSTHTLALRTNGTVWAWGCGSNGRLGDGTTVNKSSPVSVVGGFTDWCQVSAGREHNIGLRQNGTAWTWGCNTFGQLGDGTVVSKLSPISVIGGFTDWCQVSAGKSLNPHSLGLRANGTLWSWGHNNLGRLGDGTTINKSSPVSVVGGFTDWCRIDAGESHNIGIRANRTAWSWGAAISGVLGDNTVIAKSSPVSVVGGFTDWCQVSGGGGHSLGVRQNGTAWAWGSNSNGILGDNTTISKSSPILVAGGFTNWCQVVASNSHSLGLRQNGTAWAWGSNGQGRLGDNTTINKSSPVSVVGGFTDWCQVSAGNIHGIALRKSDFT
jgi:alpha-tubulin suppressor-like RCC1 family protein